VPHHQRDTRPETAGASKQKRPSKDQPLRVPPRGARGWPAPRDRPTTDRFSRPGRHRVDRHTVSDPGWANRSVTRESNACALPVLAQREPKTSTSLMAESSPDSAHSCRLQPLGFRTDGRSLGDQRTSRSARHNGEIPGELTAPVKWVLRPELGAESPRRRRGGASAGARSVAGVIRMRSRSEYPLFVLCQC
jgi:hypothetical protein